MRAEYSKPSARAACKNWCRSSRTSDCLPRHRCTLVGSDATVQDEDNTYCLPSSLREILCNLAEPYTNAPGSFACRSLVPPRLCVSEAGLYTNAYRATEP